MNATNPVAVFAKGLDAYAPRLQQSLPAHLPSEKFIRSAKMAVQRMPSLTKCSRASLYMAIEDAAKDGLILDGREAAIIPFKNEAVYIPMTAGLLKLVRNSGQLKTITAHVVYENDTFHWIQGDDERIEHMPLFPGDRGKPIAVYAIAHLKDGGVAREFMTVEEVEQVRSISRARDGSAWKNWWGEMAKKSVIRRLSKRLPLSTDREGDARLLEAIERVDDDYTFDVHIDGDIEDIEPEVDKKSEPAKRKTAAAKAVAAKAEADKRSTRTAAKEQAAADAAAAGADPDTGEILEVDYDSGPMTDPDDPGPEHEDAI